MIVVIGKGLDTRPVVIVVIVTHHHKIDKGTPEHRKVLSGVTFLPQLSDSLSQNESVSVASAIFCKHDPKRVTHPKGSRARES